MKQITYPMLIPLLLLVLLTACVAPAAVPTTADDAAPPTTAPAAASSFPLTITHDRGAITLEQPAERIVVFSEEFIELFVALDLAPVGVGLWRNEPTGEIFNQLPYLDQPIPGVPRYINGSEPNLEVLAALQPDLILHHDYADEANAGLYDSSLQIAPTLAYSGAEVGGWKRALRGLAQATGRVEAAETIIADYDARVVELQTEMAPVVAQAPDVALLLSGIDFVGIFDERFAIGGLIEVLGFALSVPENIEVPEAGYVNISVEHLRDLNTDTVVQMRFNADQEHTSDPILASLPMPTLHTEIYQGMGYTGPFAETIYLDGFADAFRAQYLADATAAPAVTTTAALFPLTITDALGQEFTFETQPKLACDWYGCYETMADLGVVLHAAAMKLAMTEQPFYSPVGPPDHLIEDLSNPELWAATEMDVFLSRVPDDPYYDVFRQMVPVFFLHHPSYGVSSETGYQAYIANARLLGQLSGQPEAAEAAIAQFETMLANLRALSTQELAAQTVGILWSEEVYSGLATNNPFCVLLADVGLGRCMGESTGRFVEYNAEEVLALNPDLIIYMLEGGPSHTERTDPVWGELTAVKEGRVYDVIGTRYTCCSMRGLIHSFQEYVSHVLPEAGIPAPGPVETFDPSQSPLIQADFATAQK